MLLRTEPPEAPAESQASNAPVGDEEIDAQGPQGRDPGCTVSARARCESHPASGVQASPAQRS